MSRKPRQQALVLATPHALEAPRDLVGEARGYLDAAKSDATKRAYESDWAHFEQWAKDHQAQALPASVETVAEYITDLAAVAKVSTLERRIAAITHFHKTSGAESPARSTPIRTLMSGIRRTKGTKASEKKPVLTEDLRTMLEELPDGNLGIRDRALLLVGFAGGFRRSELVSLDFEDLDFKRAGLAVTLRRSKTDQEGEGRKVGINYGSNVETCPVRSLQAWLEHAAIDSGAVFRSISRHGKIDGRLTPQSVALVVKRYAAAVGKDPAEFGGHSLRAGLATQAAESGASERSIMNQTGHKSLKIVRKYIREGSLFRENASAKLGL
jgi:site-specific recombinase XerD